MIFSKNSRKAPHLLSLLVAFAVAVGMWYVVSAVSYTHLDVYKRQGAAIGRSPYRRP